MPYALSSDAYLHPEPPSITETDRRSLSPRTLARREFVLWAHARHRHQRRINPRRELVHYLRDIGTLRPQQRWTSRLDARLLDTFGLLAIEYIRRCGTVPFHEFHHRLISLREAEDDAPAPLPTSIPDPTPDPIPTSVPEHYTDGDLRALDRKFHSIRRAEFAAWLDTRRRGACSPRRAYNEWRGLRDTDPLHPLKAGRTPYKRFAEDIRDVLGPEAARLILGTKSIDRTLFASKLRSLT